MNSSDISSLRGLVGDVWEVVEVMVGAETLESAVAAMVAEIRVGARPRASKDLVSRGWHSMT
eukprot:1380382-Amorphochlora_amoeboformis.AAC.2